MWAFKVRVVYNICDVKITAAAFSVLRSPPAATEGLEELHMEPSIYN